VPGREVPVTVRRPVAGQQGTRELSCSVTRPSHGGPAHHHIVMRRLKSSIEQVVRVGATVTVTVMVGVVELELVGKT
jgi:hypothetical protein